MFQTKSPGSIVQNDEDIEPTKSRVKRVIEWSYVNEEILAEWCDIAQCYKWLNYHSYTYYSNLNMWFTIPIISFSTLNGTASFIQIGLTDRVGSGYFVIGIVSILIGILSTIHQYFKVLELKESFRIAYIAWDKYARNIYIELSKSPKERIDAGTFIKLSRQEYDRLMECNQIIPQHIIIKFNELLQGTNDKEKEKFAKIRKPDICDTIISINEKRHLWFQKDDLLNFDLHEDNDIEKQKFSKDNRENKNSNKSFLEPSVVQYTKRFEVANVKQFSSSEELSNTSPQSILIQEGNIRQDKKKRVTHQSLRRHAISPEEIEFEIDKLNDESNSVHKRGSIPTGKNPYTIKQKLEESRHSFDSISST